MRRQEAPILRISSQSNMIGQISVLPSKGIFIGAPRSTAIEGHVSLPLIEIPVRIEALPSDGEIGSMVGRTTSEIIWRISIDELHIKKLSSDEWKSFISIVSQFRERQRIIIDLERSVEYSTVVLDKIEIFRDSAEIPIILDSAHTSWKSIKVQGILKSLRINHAYIDAPLLPGIIKDANYYSGSVGYLRCLGRNGGKWFEQNPNVRFDYTYSHDELTDIARRVRNLKDIYDRVFVSMWNRPAAVAIANAELLANLLMG